MAAFLFVAISTIFLGIIFLKLLGISNFNEKHNGLPNGSRFLWPFIGETLAYLKPHKSNTLGLFLQQQCSKYGSVFKSHLFGWPTIVSCDLEFSTFVLQNEGTLFQSNYPKPVKDILGNMSMMLISGDLHKKLKSVALNFISASKSSPDFLGYVDRLSLSFVDSWRSKSHIVFSKEAKKLTFYFMLKNLMSIEPEDPLAAKILGDFLLFMKGFVSLPIYISGNAYSKAIKARMRISWHLKDVMKGRERMMAGGDAMRGDFLDKLLEKDHLNDEEKVVILLDLLFAGYETTSGLVALVVFFLAHAPSPLLKLQEEHRALRKTKKDGEPLNWEDYKKMEFTSHVINETLRCGNLVKFLHRKTIKDVKYKDYIIPAGWQVLTVLSATNLDPKLHERPTEFNPWRWVDDSTTCRKVIPFGGGLRYCPGAELGKLETAFFLHHFVLNFRWKTKEGDYPISHPYLEFKKGLVLEIEQI